MCIESYYIRFQLFVLLRCLFTAMAVRLMILYFFLRHLSFLSLLFTLHQCTTYSPPPGTYNPNARESDACTGSNRLWTRTLHRYTRTSLPDCVVSIMSGLPPETADDKTRRTHAQSQHRN